MPIWCFSLRDIGITPYIENVRSCPVIIGITRDNQLLIHFVERSKSCLRCTLYPECVEVEPRRVATAVASIFYQQRNIDCLFERNVTGGHRKGDIIRRSYLRRLTLRFQDIEIGRDRCRFVVIVYELCSIDSRRYNLYLIATYRGTSIFRIYYQTFIVSCAVGDVSVDRWHSIYIDWQLIVDSTIIVYCFWIYSTGCYCSPRKGFRRFVDNDKPWRIVGGAYLYVNWATCRSIGIFARNLRNGDPDIYT